MTAPARQQVICALAVALDGRDELVAALFDALAQAEFDPATGVLSGPLGPGARFAAWLGPQVPPFPGRTLFLDLGEGAEVIRLARCLAPHELRPVN